MKNEIISDAKQAVGDAVLALIDTDRDAIVRDMAMADAVMPRETFTTVSTFAKEIQLSEDVLTDRLEALHIKPDAYIFIDNIPHPAIETSKLVIIRHLAVNLWSQFDK